MSPRSRACPAAFLRVLLAAAWALSANSAAADTVQLTTGRDSTIYQFDFPGVPYDPGDPNTGMKANGQGNYIGAGRTRSKNQIQRALLECDFQVAGIPTGAHVDSVSLRLYVVDYPKKEDPLVLRDFWLVALPELSPIWGEGPSDADAVSGGGGGADPGLGDATWFHAQYDPGDTRHYDGALSPPWAYHPNESGFWPQATVTSPAGLALDLGEGLVGDAPFILPGDYAAACEDVGGFGYVTFASDQMALDVQRWLDDPATNFGWLVLGEESVSGKDVSSKRGFASFQHENTELRPVLTVNYSMDMEVIPEPSTLALAAIGAALLAGFGLRRRW